MTTIRNLTTNDITIYVETEAIATYPAEGKVWLNANYAYVDHLDVDGIPVPVLEVSEPTVSGLPPQQDGVYLIVSGLIAGMYPERGDLLSPARVTRKSNGTVECRAFLTHSDAFPFDEDLLVEPDGAP